MNNQNIGQSLQLLDLLLMQSVTATGNGTGVDLLGYEGEIAVILSAKNTAGVTPTLDVKLQDSADNSTFTDISGAAFTQVTDAGTSAAVSEKIVIKSDQVKRYVRAVKTIGGTSSPAFDTACHAVGVKKYPA